MVAWLLIACVSFAEPSLSSTQGVPVATPTPAWPSLERRLFKVRSPVAWLVVQKRLSEPGLATDKVGRANQLTLTKWRDMGATTWRSWRRLRGPSETTAYRYRKIASSVGSSQNSPAMGLNPFLEVTLDAELGLPLIRFKEVNVQIVNGVGPVQIEDEGLPNYYDSPILNGLGNLIIGYNETGAVLHGDLEVRTGSHNLVVGPGHTYSSYGGVVAGFMNRATGVYATVTGGSENTASAPVSSVSGGNFCRAQGNFSSVSGGVNNVASDFYSWAAGDLRWPKP